MRITIHQPEHLPWAGFFHKISDVDTVVILDSVQFRKNYFQNRNKIRSSDGWSWITVPVYRRLDTLIKDVTIVMNQYWQRKWIDSIYHAYKKATYFEEYFDRLAAEINKNEEKLSLLNFALIKIIGEWLGIKTDFIFSSQLDVKGKGNELILDICKSLNATTYLSGVSGKEYLSLDDFTRGDIRVEFQEFYHPIYSQLYEPFIPCMSIIDILFNYGKKSLEIVKGKGVPVMEHIFI